MCCRTFVNPDTGLIFTDAVVNIIKINNIKYIILIYWIKLNRSLISFWWIRRCMSCKQKWRDTVLWCKRVFLYFIYWVFKTGGLFTYLNTLFCNMYTCYVLAKAMIETILIFLLFIILLNLNIIYVFSLLIMIIW